MNVQHFVGVSMREVLSQVREALGEDALILETRETPMGIEVSATQDSPVGDVVAGMQEPVPPVLPQEEPLPRVELPAETGRLERVENAVEDSAAAERDGAAVTDGPAFETSLQHMSDRLAVSADVGAVRAEMQSIRSLVESHLAQVGWSETALGCPGKASVMRNLSALGIAPDIVRSLLEKIDVTALRGKTWAAPMKLLIDELPVLDPALLGRGRVALVGPSGAGKTSTLARLAARHAIKQSTDKLALVSLDNHRLGASEQIDALARLLGIAVRRPVGDRGIDDLDDQLEGKQLTLIDTVGMSQRDVRMHEQLARLGDEVKKVLVLPANLEHDAMQELVDSFRAYAPAAIALTKIDEAATLGPAISVVLRSGIPLVWLTDGQRLPEDLHDAAESRAWLVKRAAELMRHRRIAVSERYMSENFFGVRNEGLTQHG